MDNKQNGQEQRNDQEKTEEVINATHGDPQTATSLSFPLVQPMKNGAEPPNETLSDQNHDDEARTAIIYPTFDHANRITMELNQGDAVATILCPGNRAGFVDMYPGREFFRSRFREWTIRHKYWVRIGVQMGVRNTVMDEVMRAFSAPYGTWKIVLRNLSKYSELHVKAYHCCLSHMLLGAAEIPIGELYACVQCLIHPGIPSPPLRTFHYIPLLPRLRAWVSAEVTCHELFDYSRYMTKLQLGRIQEGGDVEYYDDFYSGVLFQQLITNMDVNIDVHGQNYPCYNVFIAPSCDSFQVFENESYNSWPLVAMNHNLSPDQRFRMKNVIPLGFIKGPSNTKRIDSFFIPLVEEIRKINKGNGTVLRFYDNIHRRVRVIPL